MEGLTKASFLSETDTGMETEAVGFSLSVMATFTDPPSSVVRRDSGSTAINDTLQGGDPLNPIWHTQAPAKQSPRSPHLGLHSSESATYRKPRSEKESAEEAAGEAAKNGAAEPASASGGIVHRTSVSESHTAGLQTESPARIVRAEGAVPKYRPTSVTTSPPATAPWRGNTDTSFGAGYVYE